MRFWRNARGMTAAEMLIGVAVGGITMLAVGSAMTQMNDVQLSARMQSTADQYYFRAAQIARSPVSFAKLVSQLNDAGLRDCLAQKGRPGVDCRRYQTADVALTGFSGDELNGLASIHGPCVSAYPPPTQATSPLCVIRRLASYHFECPSPTYCTGVRTTVRVEAVPDANGRVPSLRPREGSFVLYNRDFQSKAQLNFTCGPNSLPLFRLDYENQTGNGVGAGNDQCSYIDEGASCGIAMKNYGADQGTNCQPAQPYSCRGNVMQTGFVQLGIYSNQDKCSEPRVFPTTSTPVTPTAVTCPNGGAVAIDGSCFYSNRWCPLASPTGPELGFVPNDPGMVMQPGCGWSGDGLFYMPGQVATGMYGMTPIYAVCKSGPAANFPLDDSFCAGSGSPVGAGTWRYTGWSGVMAGPAYGATPCYPSPTALGFPVPVFTSCPTVGQYCYGSITTASAFPQQIHYIYQCSP